jgi:hypothetical protein
MPSRQSHKSHFAIDFTRKSEFLSFLVRRLRKAGRTVVYGAAEDPEFASTLPLASARWVVSSVPQLSLNLALSQALSRQGYSGRIAVTAHNDPDARRL